MSFNRRLSKYILSSVALHFSVVLLVFTLSYWNYERVYDSSVFTTIDVISTKSDFTTATPTQQKNTPPSEVIDSTNENLSKNTPPPPANIPTNSGYRAEGSIGGYTSSVDGVVAESAITKPAKLVSTIKANRTDAARKADYSGVAVVELIIDTNGDVVFSQLTNNLDYGLNEVALNIARNLKFTPAEVKSRAVKSRAVLKIKFTSTD